jgi:hypothetical protein
MVKSRAAAQYCVFDLENFCFAFLAFTGYNILKFLPHALDFVVQLLYCRSKQSHLFLYFFDIHAILLQALADIEKALCQVVEITSHNILFSGRNLRQNVACF